MKRKPDRAERNTEKNRRNWEKTNNFFDEKKIEKRKERINEWRITVVCTINKICAGDNTSRDTREELKFRKEHPRIVAEQWNTPEH